MAPAENQKWTFRFFAKKTPFFSFDISSYRHEDDTVLLLVCSQTGPSGKRVNLIYWYGSVEYSGLQAEDRKQRFMGKDSCRWQLRRLEDRPTILLRKRENDRGPSIQFWRSHSVLGDDIHQLQEIDTEWVGTCEWERIKSRRKQYRTCSNEVPTLTFTLFNLEILEIQELCKHFEDE